MFRMKSLAKKKILTIMLILSVLPLPVGCSVSEETRTDQTQVLPAQNTDVSQRQTKENGSDNTNTPAEDEKIKNKQTETSESYKYSKLQSILREIRKELEH